MKRKSWIKRFIQAEINFYKYGTSRASKHFGWKGSLVVLSVVAALGIIYLVGRWVSG